MNKISTIIFDFWGVLTQKWEIFSFLNQCEIKYSKSLADINSESKENWDKAAIGLKPSEDYWELLSKHFWASPIQLLDDCISNDGFNKDIFRLLTDLRVNYKLWMITNIVEDWFNKADSIYNIRSQFDSVITSYEVWIVKPNLWIYKYTLKKMNIEARECIFIDDKEKNIEAAKDIWMNGIVFKDIYQLKKELKEFWIEL